MGGSSSKLKQVRFKVLPKFWHVDRYSQKIVLFDGTQPAVYKWPEEIPCYLNSAMCLSNDIIYIAGGTDISGKTQSLFVCFDTKRPSMRILPDLPIYSKFGYLKPYKNSLFYVGGVSFEEISHTKIQTPILKYSFSHENWSIIRHPKLLIEHHLFRDLRKAGFLRIKTKLIMFGGYFKKGNKRCPNNSIVCFDLNSENLNFSFKNLVFPTNIYQPVVGEHKNKAFVAGGKLIRSSYNESSFDYSNSVFSENPKSILLQDNHPIIYKKSFIVLLSCPKVHIHDNLSKVWLQFSIPTSRVLVTPVIKKMKGMPQYDSTDTFGSFPPDNPCMLTSSAGDRNLIYYDNKEIEFISNLDTDEIVRVPRKKALKLFALLSANVENKRFTALDAYQISSELGNRQSINIAEFCTVFSEILKKEIYILDSVFEYYKSVVAVLEKSEVKEEYVRNVFNLTKESMNKGIGKGTMVFLLTRIIKLIVVGV